MWESVWSGPVELINSGHSRAHKETVSRYISLAYGTVARLWLQSGREELFLGGDVGRGSLYVCLGARCKRRRRWWGALRFELADPCTGHSSQIHRLTGHLQEDSAGGFLSPWKHWVDQGYIGANYKTVSLTGQIYWKTVRGATVSVRRAQRVADGMQRNPGCNVNELSWGMTTRGNKRKVRQQFSSTGLVAFIVFVSTTATLRTPALQDESSPPILPSSWIICYAYDCRLHFN